MIQKTSVFAEKQGNCLRSAAALPSPGWHGSRSLCAVVAENNIAGYQL